MTNARYLLALLLTTVAMSFGMAQAKAVGSEGLPAQKIAMQELVVDTTVAAEVREIMLTPPPFLIQWAERTPVFRTDRADMGHAWAKV